MNHVLHQSELHTRKQFSNCLFVKITQKNLHLQIGQKDVNFNSDNFLVFREINMQTKIKRKISISVH